MTDVQTDRDLKTGYSSMCRRDEHVLCTTAGARCTCTCHGRDGQQARVVRGTPKDRPIFKEPPMPEPATITPLHSSDTRLEEKPSGHTCDVCGRTFESRQGYQVNFARTHRPPAKPDPSRTKSPKLDTRSVKRAAAGGSAEPEDDYDPWLVVVGVTMTARAETVALSTRADAEQVKQLLETLGHRPWMFRVADGR